MLCGSFRKKRRHPGEEYRLVRSNTMPRILSMKEGSLVTVRRTKSSRVAARSSHLRDLLHTVSHKRARSCVAIRYSALLRGGTSRAIFYRNKVDLDTAKDLVRDLLLFTVFWFIDIYHRNINRYSGFIRRRSIFRNDASINKFLLILWRKDTKDYLLI